MPDDPHYPAWLLAPRAAVLCAVAVTALGLPFSSVATAKPLAGVPGIRLGPPRSAFYTPPAPLPKRAHGSVIWARVTHAPKGARAYRILYTSTTFSGKRVAVSGFVVAPKGRAPRGGRPVLAWAHGTEGLADNCAPSTVGGPARELVDYFTYGSKFQQDTGVPALAPFLKAGYAIVATDYQGLGTPGTPQYTVAATEVRNVFDSVLAARRMGPIGAGKRVVALGWSQGGGAAVFMGQQSGYARGLRLLGVAGLAPAVDIGPEFAGQTEPGPVTATSPAHSAAIRLNVYGGFAAAYSELSTHSLLTPAGAAALQGARKQCINHFAYVLNNNLGFDPNPKLFPSGPFPEAWRRRFTENTAGYAKNVAPQLIMQGTADTVVNPHGTTQYVQRACRLREPIEYTIYPGQTHQTIPGAAKPEYLPWIADRFAGKPAPSNC
jgi:alpha-beta hydrolase superfamily lysophospholipase